MESLLLLEGGGFPPFSSKNCVQELFPVSKPSVCRTLNGSLVTIPSDRVCNKYKTVIHGSDQWALALNRNIGEIFVVSCISRLWQVYEGQTLTLLKPYVDGSVYAMTHYGKKVDISSPSEGVFEAEIEKGFISYRPKLNMCLLRFFVKSEERSNETSWQLELEEI